MTAPAEPPASQPVSAFTVTQYLSDAADRPAWHAKTSPQLDSAGAIGFIRQHAAESADLGFADGLPAAVPDPQEADSAQSSSESADVTPVSPADVSQPGDS